MANPLYIWSLNQGKKSACNYYRIEVPMEQLGKRGAQVYVDTGDPLLQQESKLALLYSDIAHFYSLSGELFLHQVKTLRKIKPGKRGDTVLHPPALIYDADDNTDYVHPFNTTFGHLGVRDYPDGKLLRPGDALAFTSDDGTEYAAWVDKETKSGPVVFDIERNLYDMKVRHQAIRMCHGATVPNEMLARYYREVIGQKNVYIFPNTIDLEHYEHYEVKRKDDRVRILWQGSQSHYVDWFPLREAIREVCQKYRDKITFVMWGEKFDWINDIIPDDMLEFHGWSPYDAYKLRRGLLNIDINLCPLVNNPFNACKSAIKWYEGSIWTRPEATLAQAGNVYSEIEDGVTGMLFKDSTDFVQKLSTLIDDADLRTRLGQEAKKWVLNNRLPEHTIPGLMDFYLDTRATQKREAGDPIVKPATLDDLKSLTLAMR